MNTFKAHTKPVYNLAFSPDGRQLLSSGGDQRVALWSLESCQEIQEWPGSQIYAPIAFSPDGCYIGTGGYSIRVWPVSTDQPPLIDSKEYATSCSFSPDGRVFATFGAERAIMRWDIPGGTPLPGGWGGTRASNNGIRFPVGGMAYHPEGALIANCYGVLGNHGFDTVIHLWDADSGALVNTFQMDYAQAHPTTLAFSPEGTLLAANTGSVLRIWDVLQGQEIATLQVSKKHYKGFAFTGDSRALLAVNGEREIRCWETAHWNAGMCDHPLIGDLTAIAVSGVHVAVGSSSGKIMIFELHAG